MCSSVNQEINGPQKFYAKSQTTTKMPRPSLHQVRDQCRIYARQFNFPEQLFNRIPMYIFQYFGTPNPLTVIRGAYDSMDIITIFMIINKISAELMMAFYASADQELETTLMVHDHFQKMWQLHGQNNPRDLCGIFGTLFSYHLETRTLRRVDMSIVLHHQRHRSPTHFVPNQLNWQRAREVRTQYRNGQYRINDLYDLAELRMAWYGGLRIRRGRYNVLNHQTPHETKD